MKFKKAAAAILSAGLLFSTLSMPVHADWHQTQSGKFYYTDSSGKKVTGWKTIDGDKYYFDSNGYMKTGWLKLGDTYYYLQEDGKAARDITLKIDGKSYTFDKSGKYVPGSSDGWHKDSNGKYYYTKNNKKLTGLNEIDGNKYYFKKNGTMHTGWLHFGPDYLYFKSDGTMVKNTTLTIDGITYKFSGTGNATVVTVSSADSSNKKSVTYVLNTNTKKFHYEDCSSVKQMNESNKEYYTGDRDDIIAMGYDPCKRCNP